MSEYLADGALLILVTLSYGILGYFLAINTFYLVLMLSGASELLRSRRESRAETYQRLLSSELLPRITVLVPAFNEATTIEQSLRALLTLSYPNLEIVVVDDGSTDETMPLLVKAFNLSQVHLMHDRTLQTEPIISIYHSRSFPHLLVAMKMNGGKADTLNAALNLASGELACAVDADTIINADALPKLVRPFLRSDDIVATGATVRIANGCTTRYGRIVEEHPPRGILCGIQAVEYLRAFLFGRVGWNRLGGNLVISGAFGLFRRNALLACGGYARTVGEDMELIVRLRRLGYEQGRRNRVEFLSDPVAWTEAPASLRVLGRQRDRWHRGLTDVLWRHRRLLFNPRYGVLGLVVMPVFAVVEWFAPVVEAAGLLAIPLGLLLGVVDVPFALLFLAGAYGLSMALSSLALLLEELTFRGYGGPSSRIRLLGWALLEGLGYRQLTVYWRLRGILGFLRRRHDWGTMHRKGFHPHHGS
ncbi:MAG: glycosyltransferase family 2 protein [Micromonosporaceae bacterium]|nr:glycosyltransferase family 2 protein [Micromonosporaceae bacterium]